MSKYCDRSRYLVWGRRDGNKEADLLEITLVESWGLSWRVQARF
jgi:hypothetical protein